MMRKFLLLLLIFTSDFVTAQTYNYYERNLYTGEFEYCNLNFDTRFRYEIASDSVDKIVSIKGYYFNSNDVKFIDTITNSRIQKIEYFDKKGNLIANRSYEYLDDNKVASISAFIFYPTKMFFTIQFDYQTNTYFLMTEITNKNQTYNYQVANGYFNKNEMSGDLHCIYADGKTTQSVKMNEELKKFDKESVYKLFMDSQLIQINEEKERSRTTTRFDDKIPSLIITEIANDEREEKYVSSDGSTTVNSSYAVKYKYKQFRYLIDDCPEHMKKHTKSEVQDEYVILSEKSVDYNFVFLPFDFFDGPIHRKYIQVELK